MAQASAVSTFQPQPDKVSQLIGRFDSLPDWLPHIPKSELNEGRPRTAPRKSQR
jgi:hypothetical protein